MCLRIKLCNHQRVCITKLFQSLVPYCTSLLQYFPTKNLCRVRKQQENFATFTQNSAQSVVHVTRRLVCTIIQNFIFKMKFFSSEYCQRRKNQKRSSLICTIPLCNGNCFSFSTIHKIHTQQATLLL